MMRAARLIRRGDQPALELKQTPVPWVGAGQVLVRMTAAPIHASDIEGCRVDRPHRRPVPTTPGTEGAGEVVASGGGLVGRMLLGRRVAMLARPECDGTWAEYAVTDARLCMPLAPTHTESDGATLLLNPLTALAVMDLVRASPGQGVIITGASGALGRMFARLARREGIGVVAVVRRAEAADDLLRDGAGEVLIQDDVDLPARLRRAARAWRALIGVDTVGGALCGELLGALPDRGEVVTLARQSSGLATFDPLELVHHRKQLRGFSLHDHLEHGGASLMLAALPRLRRFADALRTDVRERVPLEAVPEQVMQACRGGSSGASKVVITFS
jgi:NADPH:quinone reductase-like Zn-dependent oxidoreductase